MSRVGSGSTWNWGSDLQNANDSEKVFLFLSYKMVQGRGHIQILADEVHFPRTLFTIGAYEHPASNLSRVGLS